MLTRLRLFSAIFLIFFVFLLARLFYWQIVKGKQLSAEAQSQYQKSEKVIAPRGNILSSDGSYLAAQDEAYLVYAYVPEMEEDINDIADKLAPLLADTDDIEKGWKNVILDEANRLKSQLTRSEVSWIPLKHKVDSEVKDLIESLNIAGIGFENEEKRVYPEASSAAHLLGFVGKNSEGEDQGYFGLEGYYDLTLSGKPGYLTRESDARGIPILLGDSQEVLAIEGVDLITHINKTLQIKIDKELRKGLERYGAVSGTVLIMDPKNGGILAQSSYPAYDPTEYQKYSNELFKNPAVSSSFEPGSVFKILVMSAALDADVLEPETKCEVCAGPLKVDKYFIDTWNQVYRPDSTMTDVIVHSDNVGMAWVAQQLTADNLYDYLEKFGIGSLTGVDLQGESTPKLREKGTWSIVDVSTTGFGQGVAVTPMQMLRAVGAIANGGIMVTPQVVDRIAGDGWEEDLDSKNETRVISAEAAKEMTAMMELAAESGEAKWTHLRGFKVAGKTGTAQIPIAGHYDEEKTIASFIGFAPYDDPKFVMLVTLREPSTSPWASETAAPLWYSIAKDLFLYFGIQPEK